MTRTVLVVDDEPDIRELLRKLLEMKDYTVLEAADGPEAMAILEEHDAAVVLLDMRLPGIDGEAVLQLLRASPRLERLPVIGVSAFPVLPHEDIEAKGFAAYIVKPFRAHELLSTLERVLGSA